MKCRIMTKFLLFATVLFCLISCGTYSLKQDSATDGKPNDMKLMPIGEDEPIIIAGNENPAGTRGNDKDIMITKPLKWAAYAHASVASISLYQCGVSQGRIGNISDAANYPDTYQAGLDNGYKQQWYHAYIYDDTFGYTYYLWGGADVDFNDNIEGSLGGNGYDGYSAGYYYGRSDQKNGDRYLGYALHYIEDVSIVLHSTAPDSLGITVPYYTVDMAVHHCDYEKWVDNNLTTGWKLIDAVSNDYYYYIVTDLKQSIKNAAWNSCAYKGTSSVGYSAWKAYRDCGYPTSSGSGNSTLADNTKKMLIAAGRYAKGAIKYTLDKYGQWTSLY
jgi:hypothetical protein